MQALGLPHKFSPRVALSVIRHPATMMDLSSQYFRRRHIKKISRVGDGWFADERGH